MECLKKKKIGIIGGGCAGTTLAWLLSKDHNVKLFENSSKLGGHIYTHRLNVDEEEIPIDMGVDHINEKLCPNIFAVLNNFGIKTFAAPLSMSVSFCNENDKVSRWSNSTLNGELKKELWIELNRFHEDMTSVAANIGPEYIKTTIRDFLSANNYSEKFALKALTPLLTSYYGPRAPSLDYSLFYTALSFDMNLLSFVSPGYWRKTVGGMISYIEKMYDVIKDYTYLNSAVYKVRKKTNNKIEIVLKSGDSHEVDEVVFATHADIALECIEDPSHLHKEILSNFGYTPINSVGHFDSDVDQNATAQEYFSFYHGKTQEYGSLSRINNNLYPYRHIKKPLMVTFDSIKKIDENKIFDKKSWKLQMLRPRDSLFRSRIREIQGIDNLWFCGTDTSITGHEGAMVSAFVLADRLGVEYIYKDNKKALEQFNIVKFVMGI